MKLLFLMILFGLVDDFVFQPVILSKLKQKKFWKNQELDTEKYKNDYIGATIIHSLEWTLMVMVPVIVFVPWLNDVILTMLVLFNVAIHSYIDNLKSNELSISLVQDQTYHLIQILFTWIIIGLSI